MGKVQENKINKHNRLMEAAYALYTHKGFADTTISDIVKDAGTAKGTFYLYFKDKYDIQEKLIARKAKQLFTHAKECSGYEDKEDIPGKILAIIDDILEQLKDNKLLLKFINKNLSWGLFKKVMEDSDESYVTFLEEIIGDTVNDTETRLCIYTIFEMVGATVHNVILYSDPVDFETYKPYLHKSVRAVMAEFQIQ
ncbi:MAG: TetR/AcrR family transcriptional regulator [Lachnospiraceae bacterium]|nr:TetR/AcrR family transcriptional regulator [Candidatus Equihabitans merdae]